MSNITAGMILHCRFVMPNTDLFSGYIDYINRTEAIRADNVVKFDSYVANYMDNYKKTLYSSDEIKHELNKKPEKISALFTSNKDNLNKLEKSELQNCFKVAQRNNSVMWQPIISFDTKFLEQCGIYDSKRKIIDEHKIRELTRASMNECLKNENLTNTAVWSAAIHYNTNHIHVHIAMVEPHPTREEIIFNGKKQFKGKFKAKTIKKAKSSGMSILSNNTTILKKLNNSIRQNYVAGIKNRDFLQDIEFFKMMNTIYNRLPKNRSLWNYKQSAIADVRPLIDNFSKQYLKTFHKHDFNIFNNTLKKIDDLYKTAYGKSKHSSYYINKMNDLYYRMGNALLKSIKDFDYENNNNIIANKKVTPKQSVKFSNANKKISIASFYRIKRLLNKTYQSQKNQSIHRQILNNIEENQRET